MIRLIEALGYRSLRDIHQTVERFDLLVGPNASGKSTFLDTVGLLGQVLKEGPADALRKRSPNFQDLTWMRSGSRFEIAVEAEIPVGLQAQVATNGNGERNGYRRLRYELALGMGEGETIGVLGETLWLKSDDSRSDPDPGPVQREIFPEARIPRESLARPAKSRSPSGWKSVIKKSEGGNDYFKAETSGWNAPFKFGPQRLALANLPEDEGRFPVAVWFRRLLSTGIQNLVLSGERMRAPSPPGSPTEFQLDGSNLPWVIHRLHPAAAGSVHRQLPGPPRRGHAAQRGLARRHRGGAARLRAAVTPDRRPRHRRRLLPAGRDPPVAGELAAAEQDYRRASELGGEEQPGLALLRIIQGRPDAASSGIRRALGATTDPLQRVRFLPAYIEIMVAAGDLDEAGERCRELEAIGAAFDTDVLVALAAQARGVVQLAEGDASAAMVSLRRALAVWQLVDAPYLVARLRVLVGRACRALGDQDGAALELDAAGAVFERLGAAPDLRHLVALSSKTSAPGQVHVLTHRELEVLRLVAAGKTNKAIAKELFLSEKTVDRHVSRSRPTRSWWRWRTISTAACRPSRATWIPPSSSCTRWSTATPPSCAPGRC